ncbi:DUF6572 domain-containing protein [Flavobacterium caeni]|uniref:Uncharacterized protein n=1 Tax=Flavobacterium caeni TaxID=490189 RepID=A0A1G5KC68_9FLAO|nr:DUF6572 domain-containing protein [Flavobacterium caeni]SCY98215.1 hypothetical protein SAMN02927903_03228 [Flavobacterium caeni]
MSVEQTDKIDFISITPNQKVQLTISDHLEWDENGDHILILQKKLNAYLDFIESGQIPKNYSSAREKGIIISISIKFFPNEFALNFLKEAEKIISSAGYEFSWEYHP